MSTSESSTEGAPRKDESAASEQTATATLRNEMNALREQLAETQKLLREIQTVQSTPALDPTTSGPEAPLNGDAALEVAGKAQKVGAKGAFYLGGTFGASYRARDNVQTLFGTMDDGHRLSMALSGVFGRVLVEDSFGLGMVITYDRKQANGTVSADGTTEPGDDTKNIQYSVVMGPAVRQYLPLFKRYLYVYYQAAITFGYTERVDRTFSSNASTVVSSNGYALGATVQPGIMVKATDHFAVEMGINLLGLEYAHYNTVTDYDNTGTENKFDFNLDVNLLSLQFAFVGYF
jgi:hypothetical protein